MKFLIQPLSFALSLSTLSAQTLLPVTKLNVEGTPRYVTPLSADYPSNSTALPPPAFYAVVTNRWLQGIVPIFLVERTTGLELRRLPPRGQENFTEPLFFGLPPPSESGASALAGAWKCEAYRADKTKAWPDFELALHSTNVAGRFDQTTEYRFAYLSGGSFVTNHLELTVDYIQQKFLLTARYTSNELTGTYRELSGPDTGTWRAWREDANLALPASVQTVYKTIGLYEWRHARELSRRYELDGTDPGPDWVRQPEPLCHVWLPR